MLLLAPLALFADSFEFKGQTVEFENAEHFEGADAQTGQPVHFLVFRQDGWFKPASTARGRALVVGGGGAGGYGTTGAGNPGGGGGGGEVVDQKDLSYLKATTHRVTIGAGGAQTTAGNGENGHPSKVAAGETVLANALGGGGGGSLADGNGTNIVGMVVATGGGGGGQISKGVFGQGGLGTVSDGGSATASAYAGGGGGAGANGDSSTSSEGGDGGKGAVLALEIWFPETLGIPSVFGGGGGGGQSYNTSSSKAGSGGEGGGGNGGRQNNAPGDGTANTGGGGGGGGRCTTTHSSKAFFGGAGGSGIVIIRFEDIEVTLDWISIPVSASGNDGKIFVDKNASWQWLNNKTNTELIITYSNVTIKGGLAFFNPTNKTENLPPVWARARILAVGGGGGGGFVNTQDRGGGGGGGAGGFVEEDGLLFDNNFKFSIEVGAGGVGGAANDEAGKPGGKSSVTKTARDDETQVENVVDDALGGGGGGTRLVAGQDGGSGGGSSWMTNLDKPDGGKGTEGQGHNGGKGQGAFVGGGGGGAGGKGDDTTDDLPGKGGDGRESDICGTNVWYAGGGGGAAVNAAREKKWFLGGAGGKGGGGHGAGAKDGGTSTTTDVDPDPAASGTDGLGGGGGGGSTHEGATTPAGNGGSGVVIIRLSGFVVKNIRLPPTTDFVYDAESHRGVKEYWVYTLTGTPVATNADVYSVTADLPEGTPWVWEDADQPGKSKWGKRTVYWRINQLPVDVPTTNATPPRANYFVFGDEARQDEEPKLAIDAELWKLEERDQSVYPGETCATNSASGKELPYCTLDDDIRKTNAGTHQFTATLITTDPQGNYATNFVWRTAQAGKGPMDPQQVTWVIAQAENEISAFSFADWQEGTPAPSPQSTWKWQEVTKKYDHHDEVAYQWRRMDGGPWTPATPASTNSLVLPSKAGVYELRAEICKDSNHTPGNWTKAEHAPVRFVIWRHPSESLSNYVDIQPSGYSPVPTTVTQPPTNFPVLVRLKEAVPDKPVMPGMPGAIIGGLPGFKYDDVQDDGWALRFVLLSDDGDATKDVMLPFEVDTWNPNDESLVWVRLPELRKTAKFRMYWRLKDGKELPKDYESSEVWTNGYVGVWHFSETISKENAATARSADSSGHGRDAVPAGGAAANLATMTSVPGMIGNARQNETRNIKAGNSLKLTGTEKFDFDGKMTISTWIKINGYSNSTYPRVFSSKLLYTGNYGFEMELASTKNASFRAAGNDKIISTKQIFYNDNTKSGWANVTFRINGTGSNNGKYYSYLTDSTTSYTGTGNLGALQPSPDAIFLGNDPGSTDPSAQQPSIWGLYDETRLSNVVRSDDWVKAEFESVNNKNYCTFGLVNQLQGTSGETETRVWVNYWSAEPWTNLMTVAGTEGGKYWRKPPGKPFLDLTDVADDSGRFAKVFNDPTPVGTAVATYVKMPSKEQVDFPTELGPYVITFTMANPETGAGAYPGRHILFNGDSRRVDIEIVEDRPSPIDPTGAGTNMRVLLANDDFEGRVAGNAVSNQAYAVWRHKNVYEPPTVMTNVTAAGEFEVMTNNLQKGTEHVLTNSLGQAMWTLDWTYIGNMMTADPDPEAKLLLTGQHSLPWRPTGAQADRRQVGQMVMMNLGQDPGDTKDDVVGAVVRSPWYTNGVGTVYFDAVNAFTTNDAAFRLQVEVSTNAVDNPTLSQKSNIVWRCVESIRMAYDGSAFTPPETNRQVKLDIADGDGTNRFYRIIAPIDVREPCRIRIRRVSMLEGDPYEDNTDVWQGFIVLDNVIASWPTEIVPFGPYGWYDPPKSGKEVLGWETAFSTDFPSAKEDLYARARYTGKSDIVTSARCHYRWRYLDALYIPERTRIDDSFRDNYSIVYLDPDEEFKAIAPFEQPGIAGDIEYWFDLTACVPFYKYVDYSGLEIEKSTGDYTENPEKGVTSKRSAADGQLPSRGTDWFVRLRDGASGLETVKALFYDEKGPGEGRQPVATVGLSLAEDHLWRGYLKTPAADAGKILKYRVETTTPTEPGATEPRLRTTYLVADMDLSKPGDIPGSPILHETPSSNETAKVCIDAATGFLMLQFDDRSMSLTISHSDYQDFNGWSDAVSPKDEDPPIFTGSSIEGPKKSGVSSKSVRLTETFDTWTDTPETKSWWQEPFSGTVDAGKFAGWTPFASTSTPNGWTANNGQWVARFYHPTDQTSRNNSGLAVELFGAQNGNLQVLNPDGNPRGIGKVSFSARVAQTIDFYNFCYTEAEKPSRLTNYTFITRAAFDLNENKNFAGNATLSLVAFYRSKEGCYEVRWEQLKGSYNTTEKTFKDGIARDSQRLCLYRWAPGDSGEIEPELLGAVTNNVNVNYSWSKNAKGEKGSFNVDVTGKNRVKQPEAAGFGSTDYFLPIYISARTLPDGVTEVAAGVYSCGNKDYSTETGGLTADEDETQYTKRSWVSVFYRDTSEKRLTSGAYGLLSANCEAVFLQPAKRSEMSMPNTLNFDYATNEFCACANTVMNFTGAYEECREDLAWGDWSIDGKRLSDFDKGDDVWGIEAPTPSATLQLLTSPKGQDAWTAVDSRKVVGFGTNLEAGKSDEFIVREVADKSIRLAAGSSAMNDIVVTGAEFTQWRGDSYGDPDGDTTGFAKGESRYGFPSNIVFTTGIIVTNETKGFAHKIKLSAKRTPAGQPASVRSPFFDGGTNADGSRRGEGLGMIAFTYENAQANADLLVQIATNGLQRGDDVSAVTKSIDTNIWTTVARFNFATNTPLERRKGVRTVYLGLHGVVGLMRVVLNPELVAQVQNDKVSDPDAFGEIEITKVVCRDEPNLDAADWWGWNVRTVASVTNGVSDHLRTYLPDGDVDAEGRGMPIALNCSVTEDVREEDVEDIKNHMPFVQTPVFTNNIVGEVSFKARRYDNGDASQYAEVQLYGAYSGKELDDADWVPLKKFIVSNVTYEAYSFRDTGRYSAFRLAVMGVEDAKYPAGSPSRTYYPAVRVLIDEVAVFEAVNPEMGFRYVYPFRDGMDETTPCTNVVDASGTALPDAQPLQGESWTVQAEIQKTKLPDEIDMTEHPPHVIFHWYEGDSPWGYGRWRNLTRAEGHYSAELALADGETMVFRGSLTRAGDAVVVTPETGRPVTVQYSADVIYHTTAGLELTNSLVRNASTTWVRPSWYAPVDRNAGQPLASAYTILDTIAPHRVWINEVNVWDAKDAQGLLIQTNQYVEIAVPQMQAIEGWRLDYIAYDKSTNTLCRFTDRTKGVAGYVPATKDLSKVPMAKMDEYRTNDYVFLSVQSPKTRTAKTWDGVPAAVDGTWINFDGNGGVLNQTYPIGLRLTRPSGIVEQEIVLEGTNVYATGAYAGRYSATNWIKQIERTMPGGKSQFYYVGHEYGNVPAQSIGVIRGTGAVSNDWTNLMVKTPGRVNEGQIVPFGYVLYPNGELMLVRASINPAGHMVQKIGDGAATADEVTLMIRKGGAGTNITYTVADWWETAFVTTNGNIMVDTLGKRGTYTVTVGAGMSNDVTVVAAAQPMSELRDKYGLTPENPYTPAVMDWLETGENYWGEKFQHPGEIYLADFRTAINYTLITNLDLTAMYWLDIDPTVSNWVLRAGVTHVEPLSRTSPDGRPLTHMRLKMHMEITNEQSHVAYAPYVLRGLTPKLTSAAYTGNWTSETFKITADLQNGVETRLRWLPVQWFVFIPDASKANRSGSFDENYESLIDIWDPKDPNRAIYTTGWDAYPDAGIWFRWAIDDRGAPVGVGPLKPDSTYIK